MAKKKSEKGGTSKKDKDSVLPQPAQDPQGKPLIRAIRVSQEVLDAAKTYKKEKGVSFYQLGLSAISEVLRREGYLKAAEAGKGV
ncbi:MAG: hypothetical protein HY549_07795 [Elusimicrobia bacterium]|nr:hypothetical protein [Elusimicrobiota bacterium]